MPSSPDPSQPGDLSTEGVTHLPEPLRAFAGLAGALAPELREVEAAYAAYRKEWEAGRVLANSVEALRVELTYHSNAIEGSTLSLRETQLVLEGYAPSGGKTLREVYEARNHDRALRMLERWAEDRPRSSPLADQDLLEVHAQVLAEIDPSSAGRFRSSRVLIKGTRFIPPGGHRFDDLIPRMLGLANQERIPPALQAAELHYNLVAIHPFNDGNGRTARLLMNYHLLRHGYPLAVIEVGERAGYLAALEEANAGRCGPFAAFVLRSVARSIRRLIGESDLPWLKTGEDA
jgi:Fic family protein